VSQSALSQTFTVITTVDQGFAPENSGPLVRDAAGNLYGASGFGGKQNCGQFGSCGFIYRVDPSGRYTVLYNFQGKPDGVTPTLPLVLDKAGNIYGVMANLLGGNWRRQGHRRSVFLAALCRVRSFCMRGNSALTQLHCDACTVNMLELVLLPSGVVMVIGPVVAPSGTVAVI
jgi:uncharacterized repeat protein (TIGR03803 family)